MRRMRVLAGKGIRQPNIQAAGVAFLTLAAVNLSTDPVPAGSEPLAILESAEATIAIPAPRLLKPVVTVSAPAPMADGLEPHPVAVQAAATTVAMATGAAATPVVEALPVAATVDSGVLTGLPALQKNIEIIEKGVAQFGKIPDYMATFTKQERIGGDLSQVQQISLKLRHEPLSIYMKWRSGQTGQQVIWVEGQNEGKMLVKAGGLKGRLGTLSLDPSSGLAMSQSRHPCTMVGLLKAAERILQYQKAAVESGKGFHCELRDDAEFDGRPCYRCVVQYDSAEYSPDYRKSEILIDKQLSMPVSVMNFTWAQDADPAKLDEESLIEHYMYTDIQVQQQFADLDFSRANEDYRMVR
ncbi:hypothetical protein Pan44_23750 [Caulifigura coniformis]|uniref:DUF1571 domain-containing protein n=2 Tax=Caulifigura coniformis TaxID=2527983 RepID=A0A517SDY4_9PLAN|nr:hypothetical protein Pan44_23750 [Caulifigura coniformis]